MEGLGAVLHGGVGDDDADAFDIELGVAESLEEAHPCLRDQRQQQGVVEVAAVVDVANVERDVGFEDKALGQFDFDAGHDG